MATNKIKCIGYSGSLFLLIKIGNITSSEQKCAVVSDTEHVIQLEGLYEVLDRPMTYNAFTMYNSKQTKIATEYLLTYMSDDLVAKINKYLNE